MDIYQYTYSKVFKPMFITLKKMGFKKFKIIKKRFIEQKKSAPVVKQLKVHITHIDIKQPIDKIFVLLSTKRNTGLRKILDLSLNDLERNRYLLLKRLLEISLEENYENDLTFKILRKITKKEEYEIELFWEYLKVAILSNRNYKKLFMFCLRQNKDTIIKHKEELATIVEDLELKNILKNINEKTKKYKFSDILVYEKDLL